MSRSRLVFIAFLRGINVGGHNIIKMQDLREALERHAYKSVRTYLQSGNVVLATDDQDHTEEHVRDDIASTIHDTFGFDVSVIVRSRDELADIISHDPYRSTGVAALAKWHIINFLSEEPDQAIVDNIQTKAHDISPKDHILFRGTEIHSYHAEGVIKSKAAKLLTDKHLRVHVTARNWNTVTKLLAMADDGGDDNGDDDE
eukprot:TRINITY_DN2945_c2_g1_i1.p1 TRINITY_DN2945_c2_g1~~TRINITY_DN2945_c2_g1_i1.p1  ORF type:complete len:201 (-),score=30.17 TRINITY_DN2945_c2_g1_i1:29-631(-)